MESIQKENRNHETWLNQYGDDPRKGTRKQYEGAWKYWTRYIAPKDETWTLENLHSEDWGTHLVNFREWLSKQQKKRGKGTLSDNRTKLLANAIRGYLVHIGATLSLTKKQKLALTKIESMPEKDYPINLNVKQQLMRVADPVEEYVVCAGISFGFRVGDFMKITRGTLEPLIHMEPPIQLPEIMTQKEGIKAYPFIDRDAREAIEQLLKVMDSEGRTDPSEPMLKLTTKKPEEEVNDILKRVFEKAQIPLGEFRIRFHCLRKFLTNQLSGICSADKWKWFVGKIAKSPYVSSEGREIYARVMEFTNINHRNIAVPEDIRHMKEEMKTLRDELLELRGMLKELAEKKG